MGDGSIVGVKEGSDRLGSRRSVELVCRFSLLEGRGVRRETRDRGNGER